MIQTEARHNGAEAGKEREKPKHLVTGEYGEDLAAEYMHRAGYELLGRNIRQGRCEIDIVARDGGEVVFTEVRTRHESKIASPDETIGPQKMRRLIMAAAMWAESNNYDGPYRIDFAGVTVFDDEPPKIEYIQSITEPLI